MSRITRVAAVAATVTAFAGASAVPASAQSECTGNPNPDTCVQYAFDVTQRTIETADAYYDAYVQPAVDLATCAVVELATPRECTSIIPSPQP